MKILYIANHDSGGNDDEGAIHHALETLGHRVERVREKSGHRAHRLEPADLCLFHKWPDVLGLQRLSCPKVFWYFDLVSYPDPTLEARNQNRRQWMAGMTREADLGFCTDGDWVSQDRSGKLIWLPQGADQRHIGLGADTEKLRSLILMTGIRRGGRGRQSFCDEMSQRWRSGFHQVEKGFHGRAMADLIASSVIVVAPDHPVTDRYASNRVFLTLGYGGHLFHPRSKFLESMYKDGKEITFYDSREHLDLLLSSYLSLPERLREQHRRSRSEAALERTKREHLYVHRVEALIKTVKERLRL